MTSSTNAPQAFALFPLLVEFGHPIRRDQAQGEDVDHKPIDAATRVTHVKQETTDDE